MAAAVVAGESLIFAADGFRCPPDLAETTGRPGLRDLARMARWRVPLHWWLAAVSPVAFLGLALLMMASVGKALPGAAGFGEVQRDPRDRLAGRAASDPCGCLR